MRMVRVALALLALSLFLVLSGSVLRSTEDNGSEWQVTFAPVNHLLDNNDNFSKDDRYLCYDTRETLGGGIGNCTSIGKVDITTGVETIIYEPQPVIVGASGSAPGLGAASFSPLADEVVFIHGPFVDEVPLLGAYGATNRRGAVVPADGSGRVRFLDRRDVTSEVTIPGAHRGGSHRHEYSLDGKRVGFTYDDALLTNYGRTIGMMVPHPMAPEGATHWSVLLVKVVPGNTGRPGELERAADDSWIGAKGLMRGFIGSVREADGSLTSSLFVVDVPETVDVTTAGAGSKTEYPTPPKGVVVRRLTHTPASGIVRGSHDGAWAGYFANAGDGVRQVFIIRSDGSDRDPDPARRPLQATALEKGAAAGLRWHPSGNSVAVLSDNGVAVACVQPGSLFGVSYFLTPHGSDLAAPEALVWSRDGRRLAFNRRVPTYDAAGKLVKDFNGRDFRQIFLTNFPDDNHNGIADPIEAGVIRNGASWEVGRTAAESWATVAGLNLYPPLVGTLGRVTVEVTDSQGATHEAVTNYLHTQQINFLVPREVRPGPATVIVRTGMSRREVKVDVEPVAPGLFTANANGQGVAAAVALHLDRQGPDNWETVFQCSGGSGTCIPKPIDAGSGDVILMLFGTGFRGWKSSVKASIGGQSAEVMGAAMQRQFAGLDQVNVRIPAALAGKGEVPVVVTVDGKKANPVTVNIR